MITLTGHFFRGLFGVGFLSQAGADSFTRMILSGLAGVLAAGLAMTRVFVGRYQIVGRAASGEPYRRLLLGDDLLIVGLPMLIAAVVTLAISDSLFPNEHDFRILGALPVRRRTVFIAKSLALIAFNGTFIVVLHLALAPIMLITSVNRWQEHAVSARLLAWAVASVSASVFAVLATIAIVGILILTLSRSRLVGLTAVFKGTLLGALVACGPLLLRLPIYSDPLATGAQWMAFVPPAWFVSVERVLLGSSDHTFRHLAATAGGALVVTAIVVAAAYALLFHRFETLMLRAFARPSSRSTRLRPASGAAVSPAFSAVFRFTATTLMRSQFHQTVLIALSGCGVALALNGAATWAPFALMFACAIAARASLALPLEHGANWIFRLTEDPMTRGDQLHAVERIVDIWMVGPPVCLAIATMWGPFGLRGAVGTLVVALVGLVSVHAVMLDWRRIPFTSSYLPGKRFVVHSVVLGCLAWATFTAAGAWLVQTATLGPIRACAVVATLSGMNYALRRRRREHFHSTPLMFEDERPDRTLQLELQQ